MRFEKETCKACRVAGLNKEEPPVAILVSRSGFAPLKVENNEYVTDEEAPLIEGATQEDVDVAGLMMLRCAQGHQWRSQTTDGDYSEVEPDKDAPGIPQHIAAKVARNIVTR